MYFQVNELQQRKEDMAKMYAASTVVTPAVNDVDGADDDDEDFDVDPFMDWRSKKLWFSLNFCYLFLTIKFPTE